MTKITKKRERKNKKMMKCETFENILQQTENNLHQQQQMQFGFNDESPDKIVKQISRPTEEEAEEYYSITLNKNFSTVGRLDQETQSVYRKSLVESLFLDKISNPFISSNQKDIIKEANEFDEESKKSNRQEDKFKTQRTRQLSATKQNQNSRLYTSKGKTSVTED